MKENLFMILLWLLSTLLMLIALLALAGRGLYMWLKLFIMSLSSLGFALSFGTALFTLFGILIISRIPGIKLPPVLVKGAHVVLGIVIYGMLVGNSFLLLGLVGQKIGAVSSPVSVGMTFFLGWFSIVTIFGLSFYGILNATRIQISSYHVHLGSNSSTQDEMRLVLVSDLHLGQVVGISHLRKVITAINQVEPDLVCVVGDIFDGDISSLPQPEEMQKLLREIRAPFGVFACLGNHDAGRTYPQMLAFLSDASVQVLQDEAVAVDGRLMLVGRKDSTPIGDQGEPRAEKINLPEDPFLPIILMDHQPSNIDKNGVPADLILSGHSHRGQMFPFNLVTNAYFEVDYGYYQADGHPGQIVVTSGAGTWGPPMRVGTKNEIAVLELTLGKRIFAHEGD